MPDLNRQWLLKRRPTGAVTRDDFDFVTSAIPEPGEGELLVRNLVISCDPTQRGWIAGDTYLPAVKIGEVVRSFAAGRVVTSKNPRYKEGDLVQGLFGWQDYAIAAHGGPAAPGPVAPGVPLETAMSILGMTGLTAYFGLFDIGKPQPGETVLVSGAAGATGSVVGQLAKLHGCRTIGIAGGPAKCKMLVDELGFDAAIDYKSERIGARLKDLAPKGVDVFFDNVGGEALDAALARLALRGRIVLCGGISQYDGDRSGGGPANYLNLVVKRGRMEGFLILDYMKRAPEGVAFLAERLLAGKLKDRIDLKHGLENAPETLQRLFAGQNDGKQLLRIAE